MKTKKDLTKELKDLNDANWVLKNDLRVSQRETEESKEETQTGLNNIAIVQLKSDEKSKILHLVVEILAGDASPTSKTEVLIDLFPEIKEFKEMRKKTTHSEYMGHQLGRF